MNENPKLNPIRTFTFPNESFIDRRVQKVCRVGFTLVGAVTLSILGWQSASPPIQHGNVDEAQVRQNLDSTPRGRRQEMPTKSVTDSTKASSTPKTATPKPPAQATRNQPEPDKSGQPVNQTPIPTSNRQNVDHEEMVASPHAQQPQLADTTQASELVDDEPDFQIIAGKNAPHFAFESLEAMRDVARNRGGRFMITDGKFSVEVGRELDINARFRYVGADWHWLYADRMVKLSLTEKVRQVVDAGCRQYQQLDRSRARIYLSVPHSLDRVIFEAQNRHEPTVDVHDTTIIRLSAFGRCQIIRVERVNQ